MALRPGQTLGDRYRINRALSSGGMGSVFLAEDSRAQSYCAIKMLPEAQLGPPEGAARRFEEEKALLARLNHPGLPRVRDFFRLDGFCYIVTDFVDGPSLEAELLQSIKSQGKALAPREVVRTALQVLEILQYLHNLDPVMLHRDIKPSAVVRESRSGRIMLVDFGLPRPVSETRPPTPYAAPELIGGRPEPRSDLYSLGASLNQLLSGQTPSPLAIPPLATLAGQLDSELTSYVDKACAMSSEARFSNVREMGVALHGWLQRSGLGEEPAATPVAAPPPGLAESPAAEPGVRTGARLRPPAPVTFPQKPGSLAGRPQVVPPMPTGTPMARSKMASSENHAPITGSEPPAPSPGLVAPAESPSGRPTEAQPAPVSGVGADSARIPVPSELRGEPSQAPPNGPPDSAPRPGVAAGTPPGPSLAAPPGAAPWGGPGLPQAQAPVPSGPAGPPPGLPPAQVPVPSQPGPGPAMAQAPMPVPRQPALGPALVQAPMPVPSEHAGPPPAVAPAQVPVPSEPGPGPAMAQAPMPVPTPSADPVLAPPPVPNEPAMPVSGPPPPSDSARPLPRLGGPMAPPATEPERPTFGQRPALGNRPPSSSAEGLPPAYPPPPETERLAPPAARPVSAPNSGHLGRDSAEIMDAPLPPAFPSQPPARPTPAPQAPPPADLDAPLPPPLPFARHNAPAPPPDTEDNWSEPEEEPTFKLKRPSIEVALPPKKPLPPLPVDLDAPPPMKLALERAEPTEAPEAPPTESPEAPQPRPDLAPPETTDDWAHAIPPSEVPDEALAESELSAAAPAEEPPRRKKGAIPVPLIAMLALSAVLVIGFTVGKALLGPGGDPTPTASVTATPTWTPPPPPPPPPPATATPIFGPATPSASPSPETSPEPVASVTPETSPSASASPGNVAVDPGYPVLGPEDQEPDPNAVLPDPPTPELQPDNSIKVDVPDLGLSFQVPSGMEIKRNNWGRQKADLNWKKSEPWGESRMTVQIRMGKPGPRLRATAESMLNNQWTSVAHEGPDQVNLFRPNGRGVAFFGQTVREDGHQIFIVITYSWDGNLPKEGFEQAVGEVRRRMTLPE